MASLTKAELSQMPNDALRTYLQDHLAGALHAIELLKAMRDHFSGEPLGTFAGEILAEVEADREVLARLAERTGGVKEWGALIAEKVSRIKLKHGSAGGLGTFEALEFLVIGVHGKRALRRAMAEVASFDARLQGVDFGELAARAENQHQKIEERRLAFTQSSAMATGSTPSLESRRDVRLETRCPKRRAAWVSIKRKQHSLSFINIVARYMTQASNR